jgi:hypothetical protein
MIHNLQSAAIGARMRGAAMAVAPLLVFVYTAGYMLGRWLHRSNDRLAAAYLQLLGLERSPAEAAPVAPKAVIRAAVHKAPLTVEALIAAHTQRELMVMAGTKSKRSKKQLAERILKTK